MGDFILGSLLNNLFRVILLSHITKVGLDLLHKNINTDVKRYGLAIDENKKKAFLLMWDLENNRNNVAIP